LSGRRGRLLAAAAAAVVVAAAVVAVVAFLNTPPPTVTAAGGTPTPGPASTEPGPVPSAVSPSPTGSPSTRPPPSAAPTPRSGGHGLPGGVLNLTNWKLTLPIAADGSSKAQEIVQPQLASYSVAPYFTVNGGGDGVVFQANAGGATTSGSGYPRSELREMASGGARPASWSTTSGTSAMTVRTAITHLTSVKPQVTVAQIHDDSDDVLVIRLDGPHHLYAEHNGTNYGDLDTGYVLGTPFTAAMTASGGHIRISYNGVSKVDYPVSSSGDYFKAGCYTQSNTSKGDAPSAYAEVVIYRLDVSHTG
jgi:poly(beta-D-mannuronate) lyase